MLNFHRIFSTVLIKCERIRPRNSAKEKKPTNWVKRDLVFGIALTGSALVEFRPDLTHFFKVGGIFCTFVVVVVVEEPQYRETLSLSGSITVMKSVLKKSDQDYS